MRRNPADPRSRRAARRRGFGPVEAGEFLWEAARSGRWFMTMEDHDWVGPPYPSQTNVHRAAWVRLLGYLRWERAAALEGLIASTVPPRDPDDWTEPMHLLGVVRPFGRIGPQIADDLGYHVMLALAIAATRAAAALSPYVTKHLPEALRLHAERFAIEASYMSRAERGREDWDDLDRETRPLERRLRALVRGAKDDNFVSWEAGDPRSDPNPSAWAAFHAGEAFYYTFDIRHVDNMPDSFSDAIFHASMALGFACDAGMGYPLKDAPTGEWYMIRRPKIHWVDRGGTGPQRGCMTVANRELRKALVGPALISIAHWITRPE